MRISSVSLTAFSAFTAKDSEASECRVAWRRVMRPKGRSTRKIPTAATASAMAGPSSTARPNQDGERAERRDGPATIMACVALRAHAVIISWGPLAIPRLHRPRGL